MIVHTSPADEKVEAVCEQIFEWLRESKEHVLGDGRDELLEAFEGACTEDEQGPFPGTEEWWRNAEADAPQLVRLVLLAASGLEYYA